MKHNGKPYPSGIMTREHTIFNISKKHSLDEKYADFIKKIMQQLAMRLQVPEHVLTAPYKPCKKSLYNIDPEK